MILPGLEFQSEIAHTEAQVWRRRIGGARYGLEKAAGDHIRVASMATFGFVMTTCTHIAIESQLKDRGMREVKIEDPGHIELPVEVGERLGLKRGDIIVITIEDQRAIVEKRTSSPVDASFGLWSDLPPGPQYIDTLRKEWDERLNELLPHE